MSNPQLSDSYSALVVRILDEGKGHCLADVFLNSSFTESEIFLIRTVSPLTFGRSTQNAEPHETSRRREANRRVPQVPRPLWPGRCDRTPAHQDPLRRPEKPRPALHSLFARSSLPLLKSMKFPWLGDSRLSLTFLWLSFLVARRNRLHLQN